MNGFELIVPYLQPIAHLLEDPAVSEVMINNGGRVSWEKDGRLISDHIVLERLKVEQAIRNIARRLGGDITRDKPLLDSRLPDGSRVAAAMYECSPDGPALSIRRFSPVAFTLDDLERMGSVSSARRRLLEQAVADRLNILVCGPTGGGKTTFINVLAALIPLIERIVLIEDTSEIKLPHTNIVRLEARDESGKRIVDLLKHSLRHRPDRIIVGEVRGKEAWDLLQSMNTGHRGTFASLHAESPIRALSRLATCALQSGIEMPWWALEREIADSINLVVEMKRNQEGQRVVGRIIKVLGFDGANFQTEDL
jgi:pilus assembly protein CpaF